jgi:hypothetical protein
MLRKKIYFTADFQELPSMKKLFTIAFMKKTLMEQYEQLI